MQNPYKSTKRGGRRMDEHRFIMQEILGRKLDRDEIVHHINGDKRDNRPENLRVVSAKEHAVEHGQWKHPTTKNCTVCGATFTPHPTKRARAKTCSPECRFKASSLAQRRPSAPSSKYRDDAYPCEVAARV